MSDKETGVSQDAIEEAKYRLEKAAKMLDMSAVGSALPAVAQAHAVLFDDTEGLRAEIEDARPAHDDVEKATERILSNGDRDVWVVENNPGSGWRVSAVFDSYEDAERFEDDYRTWANSHSDGIPEGFQHDVRTRHGSRGSPTKMFEAYPPERDGDE